MGHWFDIGVVYRSYSANFQLQILCMQSQCIQVYKINTEYLRQIGFNSFPIFMLLLELQKISDQIRLGYTASRSRYPTIFILMKNINSDFCTLMHDACILYRLCCGLVVVVSNLSMFCVQLYCFA